MTISRLASQPYPLPDLRQGAVFGRLVAPVLLRVAHPGQDSFSLYILAFREHDRIDTQVLYANENAMHRDPLVDQGSHPATLGDVLYAKSRPAISEQDWAGLVQSVAAGDQMALHALYERAHRLVFTLALRITANRETAEELTIDVFHDVWRRASRYDASNGTVLGWIMNQARSRAIDRVRFEHRKKRQDPGEEAADPEAATSEARDPVEARQQCEAVRAALEVLAPEERQAIHAAFFSELTHVEVAERLGQPLGTIKSRIRCGLHKLRQQLAAEYLK